ncbi:MAG: apolipoprotein N-acyltransferase [Flavobacteriales bacterium]|nr:apolipoprotein N-acyltransferase [Flavobacteriales bacterium]
MHRLNYFGLAILSGLMLGISWPETGSLAPLLFFSFVPLLFLENELSKRNNNSKTIFGYAYLTFLIFNTFSTWWIWYASPVGMILAEVLNSLFMSTIFLWFHNIKKRLGSSRGFISLIVLWIGFEWLHYNWDLSHPWSTMGNAFANYTKLIQWYEFTGALGGSLWILVVNILVFKVLQNIILNKEKITSQKFRLLFILLIIAIPSLISYQIYSDYKETENPIEVVITQPNIDPYKDKFGRMTEEQQVDRILSLAKQKTTSTTSYIVAPETALPRGCVENDLHESYGIIQIKNLLAQFPKAKFIIGANTYIDYPKSDKKPTETARPDEQSGGWYDVFNTGLQINSSNEIQIYHKSKLVLGVEKLPFASLLSPLEKYAINLGGTMGSLGTEVEAKNFSSNDGQIAPVICYESIYGDYVTDYVKKGANAIFIITNDGWWEDTPGYKQHLDYGRLRAIETRRSIARSANTGISCFINQRGDVLQATKWWEQDVISGKINLNDKITAYTKYGDYLGRLSAFIGVLILLWNITLKYKSKVV